MAKAPAFNAQQQAQLYAQRHAARLRQEELNRQAMAAAGYGPTSSQQAGTAAGYLSGYLSGGGYGMMGGVVGGLASRAGAMGNALQDSTLTGGQAMGRVAEQLPVIGQLMSGLKDLASAIQGTANALRLAQQNLALGNSMYSGLTQARASEYGQSAQLSMLGGRARSLAGSAAAGVQGYKGDMFDPIARASWERQLAIQQQQPGIQADIAGIQARQAELKKQQQGWRAEIRNAERSEKRFGGQADDFRRKDSAWYQYVPGLNYFTSYGKNVAEAEVGRQGQAGRLPALHEKLAGSIKEEQELEVQAKQRAGDQARNLLELERERLNVMRQQGDMLRGQVTHFGMMSQGGRQLTLNFLRQGQDQGFNTLTIGQRSRLMQDPLGARYVQNEIAKEMENDPVSREYQKRLGFTSLAENLAGQDKLNAGLAQKLNETNATLAATLETSFGMYTKGIAEVITKLFEKQTRLLEQEIRARNALGAAGS